MIFRADLGELSKDYSLKGTTVVVERRGGIYTITLPSKVSITRENLADAVRLASEIQKFVNHASHKLSILGKPRVAGRGRYVTVSVRYMRVVAAVKMDVTDNTGPIIHLIGVPAGEAGEALKLLVPPGNTHTTESMVYAVVPKDVLPLAIAVGRLARAEGEAHPNPEAVPPKVKAVFEALTRGDRVELPYEKDKPVLYTPDHTRIHKYMLDAGFSEDMALELEKYAWARTVHPSEVTLNRETATVIAHYNPLNFPPEAVHLLEEVRVRGKRVHPDREAYRLLTILMKLRGTHFTYTVLSLMNRRTAKRMLQDVLPYIPIKDRTYLVLSFAPEAIGFDRSRHEAVIARDGSVLVRNGYVTIALDHADRLDKDSKKLFIAFYRNNPYPIPVRVRNVDEVKKVIGNYSASYLYEYESNAKLLRRNGHLSITAEAGGYILKAFIDNEYKNEPLTPITASKTVEALREEEMGWLNW